MAVLTFQRNLPARIFANIFLKLWNDRKTLEIENSLKSYLLKAVRNYCLDELRHRRIIDEHVAYELKSGSIDIDTTENYILYSIYADNSKMHWNNYLPRKEKYLK